MLKDIVPAEVARSVLVPLHLAQHALGPPWPNIADRLSQLPTVLALDRAQQALQVQPSLPARIPAPEERAQARLQSRQTILPRQYIEALDRHPGNLRCDEAASPPLRKLPGKRNCSTNLDFGYFAASRD